MPQVIVVDYDQNWPAQFDTLYQRIWPTIQDVAISIEHVGSTSVVGLAAKPIIDMTIVVASTVEMTALVNRLSILEYVHRGDLGIAGREVFSISNPRPRHHLYACVRGETALRNHLAVRDRLRQDFAAAKEYGALKKQLAVSFENDIDGYIHGKTEFLLRILREAEFSLAELDKISDANKLPATKMNPIEVFGPH